MVSQPQYQPQRNKQSLLFHNNRINEPYSITLLYHDIFGYPLKEREFVRWQAGKKMKLIKARPRLEKKDEYFFLQGKNHLVKERLEKEEESRKKMKVLNRAREVLEKDKNILLVAITGSLAMNAASKVSDIDLMIIVRGGTLWQTRIKTLLRLMKMKIDVRRAGKSEQADKLCLNIWMDENNLEIDKKARNPYTAHEIAQIVPLINKRGVYDKFISENDWLLDYWPNSVAVKPRQGVDVINIKPTTVIAENLAYLLQKLYMERKKTIEEVTKTRAFFHPMDWSEKVRLELARRGVEYT